MGKELDSGVATLDSDAIRTQLDRLLYSSQFRNSKRCQSLLKYVVEETIDGRQDLLKERTIGVTVFGREPAYDTNQDAIVRNAAVEVRKRLAQYYLETAHVSELRIELPAGAYAPDFPSPAIVAEPEIEILADETQDIRPRKYRARLLLAAALLFAVGVGVALDHYWPHPADATLNKFWAPLLEGPEIVQICVGQPRRVFRFIGPQREALENQALKQQGPAMTLSTTEMMSAGREMLYFRDAYAMSRMTGILQAKNKPFRLRVDFNTPYDELRRSPLIAIGAFNNQWTMRLTAEARYGFAYETINGARYDYISDRENPSDRRWRMAHTPLYDAADEDYMIVTRVLASATERTVVSAAGFYNYGTLAAGEFVTDPAYLAEAFRSAPRGWEKKNIQVVLHTKIIEGTPGPPTVVAIYFW